VRSFGTALTDPELYRKWGITPPKGALLYGPPGTGKSLLARALATETAAAFYHLKLMNLTSKFGPNTGEVLQEILAVAKEQGRGVVFLDEANALSLEQLLQPAQAREASARLVAALCEKLDGLGGFLAWSWWAPRAAPTPSTRRWWLPAASTGSSRCRCPMGRPSRRSDLARQRAETAARRPLFADIDYRSVLPPMGGMSGRRSPRSWGGPRAEGACGGGPSTTAPSPPRISSSRSTLSTDP
jgi:hypothetical protein